MVTSTASSLRIPAPTHLALDASGTRQPLPHTIAMRARRSVSVSAAASPPDDATGSTGVPVQASRDPISLPRPLTSGDLMEANADDLKVAYQGCAGAYSEAAAKKAYPSCQTVPCEYFDTAFQAVENWVADRAVLPLENSLGGSIHRNYDLLLRHRLHIVGEVDNIPLNFMSLGHYFKSYHAPLIEETRSDLCSCLELIAEAPSSKILSMEVAGKSGSYFMDVDFWDNGAGFSTETYTARNGDIFILSSINPEAAEDFKRYGVKYCLAMVTEVSLDDEYQKGFRVQVAKDIGLEEDLNKLRHAIFLNNIMTNIRIWRALCFDTSMNNNFTVIKSLLAPRNLGADTCGICVKQDVDRLASFTEQLLSVNLNQSQVDAIESVISAVQCRHRNLMKLIWGPPGTGKTTTVSALLCSLAWLNCRTLTCAPTNVAVVGVCNRFLQNLKDFNKHIDENGLPFSLGDVLLFGNKYNMDITEHLQHVFFDFRVDELVECFSSLSGWRYRIASMISFFEDCGSRYEMLLEDDGNRDPLCFLDFLKKQFDVAATALRNCLMNLWIHLPGRCFSHDSVSNISTLLNMLEKIIAILCDVDLTGESLKRGLGYLSSENSVFVQPISFIERELDGARSTCLKLLKDLQNSLNFAAIDRLSTASVILPRGRKIIVPLPWS